MTISSTYVRHLTNGSQETTSILNIQDSQLVANLNKKYLGFADERFAVFQRIDKLADINWTIRTEDEAVVTVTKNSSGETVAVAVVHVTICIRENQFQNHILQAFTTRFPPYLVSQSVSEQPIANMCL